MHICCPFGRCRLSINSINMVERWCVVLGIIERIVGTANNNILLTATVTGHIHFRKASSLKLMVFGLSFPSRGGPQSGQFFGFIFSGKIMRLIDRCCHDQQTIKGYRCSRIYGFVAFGQDFWNGYRKDYKCNGDLFTGGYQSHRRTNKIYVGGRCFHPKSIGVGQRSVVQDQSTIAVLVQCQSKSHFVVGKETQFGGCTFGPSFLR